MAYEYAGGGMRVQDHGGDIYSSDYQIDFSVSLNPLGTPESVIAAACEGAARAAQYPDIRCRDLRMALSEKEQIPGEWILFGNGAAELIYAAVLSLRPAKALLVSPGFSEYERALKSAGCQIRYYPCLERDGFLLREDFADWIEEDTELLFLCNPANPTGALIPDEVMQRVLQKCRALHIRVIVDECFIRLTEKGAAGSVKGYLDQMPELMVLDAFTKTYAMAGLRLGYALCPDPDFREKMESVLQPWNVSVPAQRAGLAALREDQYLADAVRLITQQRLYMTDQLRRLGLTCFAGSANYLLFRGPENLAGLCARRGILIRDCSDFRGLGRGYYRIALRQKYENDQLLQVLSEVLGDRS